MAAVLLLTVAAARLATNAMASFAAGNGGGGKPSKQAPSTPTGLVVSSAGQTSVTLKWNASTEQVGVVGYGVVGYDVYRNGKRVASPTSTSYSLTGLTCG